VGYIEETSGAFLEIMNAIYQMEKAILTFSSDLPENIVIGKRKWKESYSLTY